MKKTQKAQYKTEKREENTDKSTQPLVLIIEDNPCFRQYFDRRRVAMCRSIKYGISIALETQDGLIVNIPTLLKRRKIIIKTTLAARQRILYGWTPYSTGNLTNKAGFPCSTFALSILER